MSRSMKFGTALAAMLAGGLACGEPPPPPRPPPAPKPVVAAPDETEKPAEPTSIYVYSPIGKRDPFQNIYAVKEVTPVKIPGGKPTPLQRFPIDKLRLALTVTGTASPMAMVEDPDGRGWSVFLGSFIGQNWGKVTSIQRDQIIITETITDHATGRVYPQTVPLKVVQDAADMASEQQLRDGESLGTAASRGK